jgi:hypothetical protein
MPSDFDWIFRRDPFWRERPKEEAPAVRRSQPTDARETRTSPFVSSRRGAASGSTAPVRDSES